MRFKVITILILGLLSGCSYFNSAEKAPDYSKKEKVPTKARSGEERSESLTALGIAYYQLGKYVYATEYLERALTFDDKNADTYQTLALIQMKENQPEKARSFFLKAMILAPKDYNIVTNYAVFLYANKEKAAALVEFNRVMNAPFYQNKWTAYTYLGFYDLESQQKRAAEINFYKALKIKPNYSPALLEMAKIRYAKTDMLSARGFIERYFSQMGKVKPLAGLTLAIKIERGLGDENKVAEYQLELTRAYPFSEAAEQLKYNNTVK